MSTAICHVVNSVDGSSIPADVASTQEEQSSFDVGLLAWFDAESFYGDEHVSVHSLSSASSPIERISASREILNRYDLVHVHHNHSGFFGTLIARGLGIPVVSTEHNNHKGFTRKGRVANGLTNPLAEIVTCVSRSVYDSFRRWEQSLLSKDQVEIIYNGIMMDRFKDLEDLNWEPRCSLGIDEDTFLIANAAMLTEQKGQDALIRAIAKANSRTDIAIKLTISGDGERREDLERSIEELNVENYVHLLGFLERREHVYKMMSAADAFAMPSRWEGFCVAVAEAMALGTPCILSDINVFRELYGGAASFHPVDDINVLADKIVNLAESDQDRLCLGKRGRTLIRNRFDITHIADQYADVYRRALAQG